jgi:hypothetical protein
MLKLEPRICQFCAKEFTPRRRHAKFCSDTCRMTAWGEAHPRIALCPHCGKNPAVVQ